MNRASSSTRESERSDATSAEAEKIAGELQREPEGVVMDIADADRDGEDDADVGDRRVLTVDVTDAERRNGDPDE